VTGVGCVTPLGADLASTWDGIIEGRDGVAPLELFDTSGCRCRNAAVAKIPDTRSLGRKARYSRASRLAIPAAREALASAGLTTDSLQDLPVIVSTSAGGMALGESFVEGCLESKRARKNDFFNVARYQPQQQVLDLREYLHLQGPISILANACSSGANAIGHAADWIRAGWSERVLTGGYEAISELLFVGFDCLQAATTDRCRPFDRKRSGLVLGEAAGFLMLEEEKSAKARGATILAELAGYGHSTDLHHLTQPEPSGLALKSAIAGALEDAGISADEVGYLNAHGTATPLNDAAECAAFSTVFEKRAPRLSSTKAAIGHTLGAAGAIEAIFSIQALRTGQLPPQLNLREPEPAVAGWLVEPGERREDLRAVLSVNLGFGGSNAALLFRPAHAS